MTSKMTQFIEYAEENPDIYEGCRRLAREAVARGHERIGISMLFEVLRYEHDIETHGDFKLCNTWQPGYARLLSAWETDLDGVFDLKQCGWWEADHPWLG